MSNIRKTTRGKKKVNAVIAPEENPAPEESPALEESDNEVEEIQQPSSTMAKFKNDLYRLKGENRLLKEEIRILKEENKLLKEQRDFNQEKARYSEAGPPSTKGSRKRRRDGSSSTDSSESDYGRKRKEKKRKRKQQSSSDSTDDRRKKKTGKMASFGKRVQSPEDVVHRYKAILKVFRQNRSLPNTCEVLKIDRNTIALTAVIADVLIAGEGEGFGELPQITGKQTLADFAKVCKAFLETNKPLQEKIASMKVSTELLPITYKSRK